MWVQLYGFATIPTVNTPVLCVRLHWYSQHPVPVQFRYLTKLSMFIRKSGYPKLRGKAAEIRWFSGPMKYIWDMYHNPAIEIQRRTFAFYAKKKFCDVCVVFYIYALYFDPPICLFSAYTIHIKTYVCLWYKYLYIYIYLYRGVVYIKRI